MLKRRASISSDERYPKVRLITQPSRDARELQKQLLDKDCLLKEAEDELDELMNCDSEQLQLLEDEQKQLFQQKTAAEIKAERLQRCVNELEARLCRLELLNGKLDDARVQSVVGLSNAQKWFPSAFEYLNQDLGEGYYILFQQWIKFKCLRDWVTSTKGLARSNRPKELSKWILNCRYDRSGNEPLLEKDNLAYGLRPPSLHQMSADESAAQNFEKEWDSLNRSGKNGWLSMLVCLKWWGMALGEEDRKGQPGEEWRNMVDDVTVVLSSLVTRRVGRVGCENVIVALVTSHAIRAELRISGQ
ncbi:hypothetical protein C8R41DRAFT_864675 [Lentinula lateritia]|uniref:Uncharacterized protein n=1 Tax=Lentinula lateritia TaxID=40482 RepID=A0ABQ8VSN3_9AGAR|nr:hypothetical protein C8R41DRAFT_864675 [Lentinula lateritia]